ncbi:MAG: phage tail protein [Lachnospiraceae bacterium]
MIKLTDAELASVWPVYMKQNADAMAISYAFQQGMTKMLAFARKSSLYSNIDELPEELLDLLALELKSQYYDESMDIGIKRNIIKNSLAWYAKGGTVAAANEMIQTVFGSGKVVEWPEFDGEPGTFSIDTKGELSPDVISLFNNILDKVKNKSATLVNVKISREIEQSLYLGVHARRIPHVVIHSLPLIERGN